MLNSILGQKNQIRFLIKFAGFMESMEKIDFDKKLTLYGVFLEMKIFSKRSVNDTYRKLWTKIIKIERSVGKWKKK